VGYGRRYVTRYLKRVLRARIEWVFCA